MPSNLELLERTLERGFPLGDDLPTALSDPDRVHRLRQVLTEAAIEDLAVEMVGDEDFRRTRQGIDGFLEAWRDWVQPFETFRTEVNDVVESGPHVVTLVRQIARPSGVDTEIETEGAAVWTFEGEKLVRVEFHLDRGTALRSAGIEP